MTGTLAVGAAMAGVVGELAGARAALWSGSSILALVRVPLVLSPARRPRHLPTSEPADETAAVPLEGNTR